jgi:hypothetical protein
MLRLEERVEILEKENKILNEELLKIKKIIKLFQNEKDFKKEIINENDEKKLSIIITRYKKSILIQNMYEDKFTTKNYKELLKELGGKWFKNELQIGWLFLGKNDNNKTLEENSEYIIDIFKRQNIELEIKYE